MSSPLIAIAALVDGLLQLDFTEPECSDAVTQANYNYDNIVEANTNRRARYKLVLRTAWRDCWIDALLEQILIKRAGVADLDRLVQDVRNATFATRDGWYPTPDPPADCHVVRDGGLADRESFRGFVGDLSKDVTPRKLLLLYGDAGTGKSHSAQLLQVVAARRGHAFASIDLNYWDDEDEGAVGATVPDVFTAIAEALDLDPTLPPDHATFTTDTRAATNWARALANQLRTGLASQRVWLFFDHVDTCSASPDVFKFIRKLAFLAALEPNYDLRVVVAGRKLTRKKAFGTNAEGRSVDDEIIDVRDEDLEQYFLSLAEHLNRAEFTQDDAAAARAEVRTRAEGDPIELPYRMWEVATERFK